MNNNKLLTVILVLLIGIILGLTTVLVIDYIEYQQTLAFERELDARVELLKAVYNAGN